MVFLEEVFEFLSGLEKKHAEKILYNIRKAQSAHDPELFKKINDDIWEFRTLYQRTHYRLLAFWDRSSSNKTLVISTHGFIKKRSKIPDNELEKALNIRLTYFSEKTIKKERNENVHPR